MTANILAAALACALATAVQAVEPPTPYGPVPSKQQLKWQQLEFIGFLHFGVNTFTGKQWGYGDENPDVFNPTNFDPDQIVRTAKMAGMKGLILTCKHHDGFCLWPSKYTKHSVKYSAWEDGKGDVVKAISKACHKYGIKFGVYLSPWDRNRADYGTPEYLTYYRNQLRELLTHYGPVFEVWFDGANGGDGYYGGAREKRTIAEGYYDWPDTWRIVRKLQPNACIFADYGADLREVGSEHGAAPDSCWDVLNTPDSPPGLYQPSNNLANAVWQPAECDVSIRPGWFYDPQQDDQVKTAQQLVDLYFRSVGHGATWLLNIPPDKQGQIAAPDINSLRGFRQILDAIFKHDLARQGKATASNIRGNDKRFSPNNAIDDNRNTYWTTDDGVTNANLTLTFRKPVTFNVVRLREYLPLGQRVAAFALDQWKSGQWVEFAKGTSIGECRLVRDQMITTDKVRLRITQAPACPIISEFGLFTENL